MENANTAPGPAAQIHGTAPHRPAIVPEKYFRWRAGEITRLEAFCDVVFGFAITLLVVSLEVPHTYAELLADMRGFLPFAACFAQLALIWRTHYKFSRRYGLEDPYTVFLNVVLLFLVLFYVYPLKFVFTLVFSELTGSSAGLAWHEGSVLMRIYALGFVCVFLLFVLMYVHAYRLRRELALSGGDIGHTLLHTGECHTRTSRDHLVCGGNQKSGLGGLELRQHWAADGHSRQDLREAHPRAGGKGCASCAVGAWQLFHAPLPALLSSLA